MNIEDVLIKFALIANLTLEEATPLMPICSDAVEDIKLKLKSGTDNESNARRLTAAAAALSFYRYSLYRASGSGMESFTAGDIKIENKAESLLNVATSIWLDAQRSISDILTDNDFIFKRV